MNYLVLYIRLESYAKIRALKGKDVTEEELAKATVNEVIVTVIFTVMIIAYPITISILLGLHYAQYTGDVILAWEKYELFYMFNFIALACLLIISTFLSLSHMRKIFGKESLQEERSMKFLLILFAGSYTLRVAFAVTLHYKEEWIHGVFATDNTVFMLCVVCLWISWDAIPLLSMLLIHKQNFSSFSNDEILYTEYSCDDNRETFQERYSFNDLERDIEKELLG